MQYKCNISMILYVIFDIYVYRYNIIRYAGECLYNNINTTYFFHGYWITEILILKEKFKHSSTFYNS